MLVISNRTLPVHASDFEITCMISDQIHSTYIHNYPFSFIAGFHCHASKNKNKTINSRIWEMKWGWYRKTLAKIQVSMIFHTRNILRNCLPKIIERFLWRRHVGAHPDGHQHGAFTESALLFWVNNFLKCFACEKSYWPESWRGSFYINLISFLRFWNLLFYFYFC